MSIERQRAILEQQLEEITEGIAELKRNRGENFSVKQLEKSKKSIRQKLKRLWKCSSLRKLKPKQNIYWVIFAQL